jgi:hypothetical protein
MLCFLLALFSFSAYSSTLKMEAVNFYITSQRIAVFITTIMRISKLTE